MTFPIHAPAIAIPRPAALSALRLESAALTLLKGVNATYFLLMWLATAYEAAMIAAAPMLFPAIETGAVQPGAAQIFYETAARGHTYLLPAVVWFLLYQGLPALARGRAA